MRFIVDESAGFSVANYLRSLNHDVLIVAEAMPEADDSDILARAVTEERIVVTNDKDFGELVFRSGQPHHCIILLRLQDEGVTNRVRVITALLNQYTEWLPDRFTVATDNTVRFRPKPGSTRNE